MDQFAVHLMPHLLTLANDRVPNVRVLLAKTLRQTLLEKGGWCLSGEMRLWCGGASYSWSAHMERTQKIKGRGQGLSVIALLF